MPFDGDTLTGVGKVPSQVSVADATKYAALCAANVLRAVRAHAAPLDRLRVVRITGDVNADPDFTDCHLVVNGASLMLNDDFPEYRGMPSDPPGAFTLHLQVDDADAWFDRAVEAGAEVLKTLADMFWGDRYGQVVDPFGFTWSIACPMKR